MFGDIITTFLNKGDDIGIKAININEQHISLIERNGWVNEGITYDRFMDMYDCLDPDKPLKITIKTYGSNVSTFLSIGRVLSRHKGKTIAIIDRYAYSGGAILALACDEIIMTENSILGGINPYYFIPINKMYIKDISSTLGTTNEWMNIGCKYFLDMENRVVTQLTPILAVKYSKYDICRILDFFVNNADINTPIYYDILPTCVRNKVTITTRLKLSSFCETLKTEEPLTNETTLNMYDNLTNIRSNDNVDDNDSVSDAVLSDTESSSEVLKNTIEYY
jgi:hypothetical protein